MKFDIESTNDGFECFLTASGSVKDVRAWLSDISLVLEIFDKNLKPVLATNTPLDKGKDYFSASELAGFIDMPTTPRGVRRRAETHSWVKRRKQGQGGGWEYHISNFSPEVQEALRSRL